MAGRLQGKVAFVTGAARGQGRSHAVRMAEEGADIIAVDICEDIESVTAYDLATEADLAETVKLVEAHDRRIVAVEADVRDPDAVAGVVERGVAELGGLDVVVANAGIQGNPGPAAETTPADWAAVIDTNLTGVFHTVRPAIPHLIARGGGSIVITSSSIALRSVPNLAPDDMSKAVLVLASDEGRYVTGVALPVDAGFAAK